MEVPPAGEAMNMAPLALRSSMMEMYISRFMSMHSASMTLVQGRPVFGLEMRIRKEIVSRLLYGVELRIGWMVEQDKG